MSDLDSLMRVHARATRDDFLKEGELSSPLWLIENDLGKRLLMAVPMGKHDDKDAIAGMMRKAIREFGGVRYVFAMEAWFVPPTAKDQFGIRPMDHPERGECIVLQGEDKNGERQGVFYEIKRHEGRKPTLSKAEHTDEFMGRFADMFAAGPYT